MTLFIKLENNLPTGHPIKEENFRQLFPQVSFPRFYTADAVEPYGYGIYDFSAAPKATGYTKYIEVQPVKNESGVWVQAWVLVDMTDEEKQEYDVKICNKVRKERNDKLAETDWTALTDVTMPPEITTYRQALRDITDHANFPHLQDSDWPEAV